MFQYAYVDVPPKAAIFTLLSVILIKLIKRENWVKNIAGIL